MPLRISHTKRPSQATVWGLRNIWSKSLATTTALLSCLCMQMAASAASPSQNPNAAIAEHITLNATHDFDVNGHATVAVTEQSGLYATGEIHLREGALQVWLSNQAGEPFRQLPLQAGGTLRYHVVSPEGGVYLSLSGQGKGHISLDRLSDQIAENTAPVTIQSPQITALAAAPDRAAAVQQFWQDLGQKAPLIEDAGQGRKLVTFLWRGTAKNVRLFGGPSANHEPFTRIEGSDLWYLSMPVPEQSRFSYRIAVDVPNPDGPARAKQLAILATAAKDVLNPLQWPPGAADPWASASIVSLPKAVPELGWPLPEAPLHLEHFSFQTTPEAPPRTITLSLPNAAQLQSPELVAAIFFDGEKALLEMQSPQALAGLTAQGVLPPIVGIYVPSIDATLRARELPGNAALQSAIAKQLLTQVESRLGVHFAKERTVAIGASFGGLAASRIALNHPDTIGAAIALSPSYWWRGDKQSRALPAFARDVLQQPQPPHLRMVIAAGTFEDGQKVNIYPDAQLVAELLALQGHEIHWQPFAGGHDWFAWRSELTKGLVSLFGRSG